MQSCWRYAASSADYMYRRNCCDWHTTSNTCCRAFITWHNFAYNRRVNIQFSLTLDSEDLLFPLFRRENNDGPGGPSFYFTIVVWIFLSSLFWMLFTVILLTGVQLLSCMRGTPPNALERMLPIIPRLVGNPRRQPDDGEEEHLV